MKTIIKYQCEICRNMYETKKEANDCEAKGIFNTQLYCQGLMWEYNHNDYVGIFCLPDNLKPEKSDPHISHSSYWACRSPKYRGDSLETELCGGDFFHSDEKSFENWKKRHFISQDKINSPEFERMAKYLKSKNITPSYYTEKGELITMNN